MIPLQNDTQALKFMFPTTENDWAIMPEKSKKQNKFATFNFITYCPSTNYSFTKGHSSIKHTFPATQNDKAKNSKKNVSNNLYA